MPNYLEGKIYKLWSPSKNIIYIGSTTQSLSKRLSKHISNYKCYKNNTYNYNSSYLVLECEDYKIELLEAYSCNNKAQLCKKEGEYIKNNECCNKQITGRTKQEYYNEHKEEVKQKNLLKTEQDKEEFKIKRKQYREANKEKIKEYKKLYYLKNK